MNASEDISSLIADNDWDALSRFARGDEGAFGALFQKHKVRVINISYRFVRSAAIAEDIAQDVFLKIFKKKLNFTPKAKFTTWLYRVTVNASLDYLRSKKVKLDSLDSDLEQQREGSLMDKIPSPQSSPLDALASDEIQGIVRRAIDRLPDQFRTIILLYQFEDLSYKDISEILAISEKAVERRLHHTRELLRAKLSTILADSVFL